MSGKWKVLKENGSAVGKATEFPPSKISVGERVSYIENITKRIVYSRFIDNPIQEVVSNFGRATATLHENLTNFEWTIKVVADTPKKGQELLDEILDKIDVRQNREI